MVVLLNCWPCFWVNVARGEMETPSRITAIGLRLILISEVESM